MGWYGYLNGIKPRAAMGTGLTRAMEAGITTAY